MALGRAQAFHRTRALVESGGAGSEIRGVAFFTRHFLKASGHFTHRFGPAGCGVRHESDVVAHVTVVLGDGDAGVDACFTRGHRHIRCIGDEHRALHERLAGIWVDEVREFGEHLGHLVAAFSATDVDDNLCVAVLRKTLLGDGFSGTERSGNRAGTAFRDREERIQNAGTRCERFTWDDLAVHRTRDADRPALQHLHVRISLLRCDGSNRFGDRHRTRADVLERAMNSWRHHHLVFDERRFLHRSQNISALYRVTGLRCRLEVPLLRAVERVHRDAAGDVRAFGLLLDELERPLDAVVNRSQQSGCKVHRERHAGSLHDFPRADAARLFVDLDRRRVAMKLDDFTDELLRGDADYFVHACLGHSAGDDERSCDLGDDSVRL